MHIVINQSNNVFGIDAENKIFAQSTETITFDVTFNDPQATLQGLYCALLSDSGKTLALTTISENKAVLDTNTVECVEYVAQWAIGTTRHAFIVVGESTKPLAIIDVEVAQNPLEGLMPPTESAPSYPTSAELKAILTQMTAQAQRAEEAVEATEEAQKAVAQYVDTTFPSKVEQAEIRLENATTSGVNAVTQRANQAIGVLDQKQAQIISNTDTKAQEVNTALDGKIATANTAINEAVGKAEQAKSDAVKAQGEAEASATRAEVALNNGCVYEVRDVADATIGLDKTLTAYKHAPTGDTSYTFNAPQGAEGKIVVFWLWVVMGETAHALTFPASVTWVSEPSFASNTQALLAFMTVDGGATWTANVQWEMPL